MGVLLFIGIFVRGKGQIPFLASRGKNKFEKRGGGGGNISVVEKARGKFFLGGSKKKTP